MGSRSNMAYNFSLSDIGNWALATTKKNRFFLALIDLDCTPVNSLSIDELNIG